MIDLKPCPFCGGTDIDPRYALNGKGHIGTGCMDCGASAETFATEQEGIDAWNTRALEPVVDRITEEDAISRLDELLDCNYSTYEDIKEKDAIQQVDINGNGSWAAWSMRKLAGSTNSRRMKPSNLN